MVLKDPHFKSCERIYTIDFSFSLKRRAEISADIFPCFLGISACLARI